MQADDRWFSMIRVNLLMHGYLLVSFNQNNVCSSHVWDGTHHCHSLMALRNLYF